MNRYIQLNLNGEPRNHFTNKVRKNSYILRSMVKKNFKAQYRNSILGVLWTVLHPLLNMLVLTLVFSQLFGGREGVGIYPVYLLCGTLIFNMMRQITTQSLSSMTSASGLIKKVKISYSVFPIANMFTALVNFGLSFIALIIVMLFVKQTFHWTIVLTITIVPAVLLFSLGIGFALAAMYVFFRDVKHLYEVFTTLWMYLTPMFYSVSMLKDNFVSKVIGLNPMTHYVTAFRDIIQWGAVPSVQEFLIMYGWAFLMIAIGYTIFKTTQKKFILYI
ncbi:MAG: ABC transporter permease [Clostridia bacterium]|nr:ABC transporter permease [Clostridia bacterium]